VAPWLGGVESVVQFPSRGSTNVEQWQFVVVTGKLDARLSLLVNVDLGDNLWQSFTSLTVFVSVFTDISFVGYLQPLYTGVNDTPDCL
jgi:hypothetical protein